jgi:hypothetical protein
LASSSEQVTLEDIIWSQNSLKWLFFDMVVGVDASDRQLARFRVPTANFTCLHHLHTSTNFTSLPRVHLTSSIVSWRNPINPSASWKPLWLQSP